jgi:hypothetical protein
MICVSQVVNACGRARGAHAVRVTGPLAARSAADRRVLRRPTCPESPRLPSPQFVALRRPVPAALKAQRLAVRGATRDTHAIHARGVPEATSATDGQA